MRIAIAGNGRLGLSLLEPLLESRHQVVALVQDGRASRTWTRKVLEACSRMVGFEENLRKVAARRGLPLIWIDRMQEKELAPLRALEPDLLFVGGFGIILKRPILDLPRVGCVNAHTSLLPRHRGPNPFSAAILAGETESGLTFHIIDEGIDTGDILEQHPFPVEPADTAWDLYVKGCDVAREHVVALVDRIERQGLRGAPQDHGAATYDPKLTKETARIDWAQPAGHIERLMRACRPFQTPHFQYRGKTVLLTHARFDDKPAGAAPGTVLAVRPEVRVATGCGSVTMVIAYAAAPVPWLWPAPWNRPKPGEMLE